MIRNQAKQKQNNERLIKLYQKQEEQRPLAKSHTYYRNNKEIGCLICNKSFSEKILENHLKSNSHRLNYCEKFFPTISAKLKSINQAQRYDITSDLLNVVASEVLQIEEIRKCNKVISQSEFKSREKTIRNEVIKADNEAFKTRPNFERDLNQKILGKLKKLINEASKKLPLPEIAAHIPYSEPHATRAIQNDVNFAQLLDLLKKLESFCSLSSERINDLIEQSLELNTIDVKLSNILFDIESEFLYECHQKIIRVSFDDPDLKELQRNVIRKIEEKVSIDEMSKTRKKEIQVECPPAPSCDWSQQSDAFVPQYQFANILTEPILPPTFLSTPYGQLPYLIPTTWYHAMSYPIIAVNSIFPLPPEFDIMVVHHYPTQIFCEWKKGVVLNPTRF